MTTMDGKTQVEKKWTANQVELLVAQHFGTRANVIVPNVYWGWGLRYEADMVIMKPSGFCAEVEIKVTAADIKADLKKNRAHDSDRFKLLYFALPYELRDNPSIPDRAGIITVRCFEFTTPGCRPHRQNEVKIYRAPKVNRNAKPISDSWKTKLLQLAHMRVWSLKTHLCREQNEREYRKQVKL